MMTESLPHVKHLFRALFADGIPGQPGRLGGVNNDFCGARPLRAPLGGLDRRLGRVVEVARWSPEAARRLERRAVDTRLSASAGLHTRCARRRGGDDRHEAGFGVGCGHDREGATVADSRDEVRRPAKTLAAPNRWFCGSGRPSSAGRIAIPLTEAPVRPQVAGAARCQGALWRDTRPNRSSYQPSPRFADPSANLPPSHTRRPRQAISVDKTITGFSSWRS